MTKLAILDRDGTIIHEPPGRSAQRPSEIEILPGAIVGITLLQQAGFVICVATNQPGPAKGECSEADVHDTNAALVMRLERYGVRVGGVWTCLHHPSVSACECRKPKPGLLLAALAEHGANPARSWMIGNGITDRDAGLAAGMRATLVTSIPDVIECGGPDLAAIANNIIRLGDLAP